eukprot:scaffold1130_cov195-Pinguiococcus_pyrenoidosus.AAC.4
MPLSSSIGREAKVAMLCPLASSQRQSELFYSVPNSPTVPFLVCWPPSVASIKHTERTQISSAVSPSQIFFFFIREARFGRAQIFASALRRRPAPAGARLAA